MGRERGIEVENLVREFRRGPRAVDGIDLRVEPGEVYGFLGPNGAGKSTTVLMLTTLLPPTSGTATVAGYDIVREGPQVRASIGAALQEAALDPFRPAASTFASRPHCTGSRGRSASGVGRNSWSASGSKTLRTGKCAATRAG